MPETAGDQRRRCAGVWLGAGGTNPQENVPAWRVSRRHTGTSAGEERVPPEGGVRV